METKLLLDEFQNLGYPATTVIKREIIQQQLNKIIKKRNNPSYDMIDQYLANQIWQQASNNNQKSVTVAEYVDVIIQAKYTVEAKLNELQTQIRKKNSDKKSTQRYLGSLPQPVDQKKKFQLQQQLRSIQTELIQFNNEAKDFSGDLDHLNIIFGKKVGSNIQQNRMNNSGYRNNPQPRMNSSGYQRVDNSALQRSSSQIFPTKTSDKLLTALFIIVLVYVGIQLLLMFRKFHFLNILLGIALISIFSCNYFDKNYIKFLIILIIITLILDIAWLILKTNSYWHGTTNSSDSNLNKAFQRFIVFFYVVEMVIKIIILVILILYRNAQKTSITIVGYNINLTGENITPISKLFAAAEPNLIGSQN